MNDNRKIDKRWHVVIFWKHTDRQDHFYIEELSELYDIVENGPDFTTIADINIRYNL